MVRGTNLLADCKDTGAGKGLPMVIEDARLLTSDDQEVGHPAGSHVAASESGALDLEVVLPHDIEPGVRVLLELTDTTGTVVRSDELLITD